MLVVSPVAEQVRVKVPVPLPDGFTAKAPLPFANLKVVLPEAEPSFHVALQVPAIFGEVVAVYRKVFTARPEVEFLIVTDGLPTVITGAT